MTEPSDLERAKADEAKARAALMETLGRIQHRVAPSAFARNAMEKARDRGAVAAEAAVRIAREHPGRAAALAAALAALIARKPLSRIAGRLFSRKSATPPADAG